jgi:hypothetical protein
MSGFTARLSTVLTPLLASRLVAIDAADTSGYTEVVFEAFMATLTNEEIVNLLDCHDFYPDRDALWDADIEDGEIDEIMERVTTYVPAAYGVLRGRHEELRAAIDAGYTLNSDLMDRLRAALVRIDTMENSNTHGAIMAGAL